MFLTLIGLVLDRHHFQWVISTVVRSGGGHFEMVCDRYLVEHSSEVQVADIVNRSNTPDESSAVIGRTHCHSINLLMAEKLIAPCGYLFSV